ncbi:MAG: hypothetical protein AAFX95_06125 [Cyanobacteria bacterium J06639_16]
MGILPTLPPNLPRLLSRQQHLQCVDHGLNRPRGIGSNLGVHRSWGRWLSILGFGTFGVTIGVFVTDVMAQSDPPSSSFAPNRREQFIQQQPAQFRDELRALINHAGSFDQPDSQVRPPLETDREKIENLIQQELVVTDRTTSTTTFTLPSLWWIHQALIERFDGDRETAPTRTVNTDQDNADADETAPLPPLPPVIDTWIAYRGNPQHPRRVDLVINSRIWNQLTYLERYTLVQQFGTSTQEFSYNLRVFSGDQPVSLYVCDFNSGSTTPLEVSSSRDLPRAENLEIPCLLLLSAQGRGAISGSTPLSDP